VVDGHQTLPPEMATKLKKKKVQKEVQHTSPVMDSFYNIFSLNSQPKLFQFFKAHILLHLALI
jgi:hypothetical protein